MVVIVLVTVHQSLAIMHGRFFIKKQKQIQTKHYQKPIWEEESNQWHMR